MDNSIVNKAADNIRILAAAMVEKAKSGHPGGAMGGADYINILFSEFLNYDPADRTWFSRDRFFLDPGHMSPMLYAQLALTGTFTMDDLKNFRQWQSITPGHPEVDFVRGIENTSGPLGQGHVMAVGAAIAERFLCARFGEWMAHKTFAFISDGGIQEEISQGAGRIAGHLGLSNLIMFFDSNDIQLSTKVEDVTTENTAAKYEAWGWRTLTINGNNADEIRAALKTAVAETEKPVLIIGKTIMGKGAVREDGSSFERLTATHGMPLGEAGASFAKTIQGLGGDAENPFVIFPDVEKYYTGITALKQKKADEAKAKQAVWEKENPDLAAKLHSFISGKFDQLDFASVEQKPNIATRAASSAVLAYLAQNVDNMIVASADLANSDKTDGFLKFRKPLAKGDFSGGFLQAGVSELTMAAICNGIALHGGIAAACATFFVFSDYMKPAIRLAALMELPVKFVFSHDSFRVGEDGPTHQPVEQEAQIRLLEQLKNHKGKMSMLVLRPADAAETSVGWKMAMENTHTPTVLIFSRQNVNDLPAFAGNRYTEALNAAKGGYIVTDTTAADVILLANGSEVSTLYAAAQLLEAKGIKSRIVSVISEGLFMQQTAEYRAQVLPAGIPVFGLTAGLPLTLQRLAGSNGYVFGLDHFGYSAPAKVLDDKFGFTPEAVTAEVLKFLGK